MARARIIGPVSGKTDWYTVEDDLEKRYDVQSAYPGYDFVTGKRYKLLVPSGKYVPSNFRLLPYQTSKRWTDVGELSDRSPATAALLYLFKDQILEQSHQDTTGKIAEVFSDHVTFVGGGCAKIGADDSNGYTVGDCVGVIYDQDSSLNPPTGSTGSCPKTADGATPTVAGYGSCPDEDEEDSCTVLYEYFSNYLTPSADYVNGGGAENPANNQAGIYYFNKDKPRANEITNWTVRGDNVYKKQGHPYGEQISVWVGDILRMNSTPIEIYPADSAELQSLQSTYPRPVYMPRTYQSEPVVLSPPVMAKTSVGMDLKCGGADGTENRHLNMIVNLLTDDTENHYTNEDGYGTGLQLPGCMILMFEGKPIDYLDGSTINKDLFLYQQFSSVAECNMDMSFKLVYAAPGQQDFGEIRLAHPSKRVDGQYALLTAHPRRRSSGYWGIDSAHDNLRYKFNVPMSEYLLGFWWVGFLLMRCFDYDGIDITPSQSSGVNNGGAFPGFFEISRQNSVKRDIYDDFMAAYPFMKNPTINSNNTLPRLSEVYFYAQGKVYRRTDNKWYPNPTKLECQRLEFFYEKK